VLDFVEQRDRRAHLPRGAVAALEAIAVHEGLLHRVRLLLAAQALDGGDLAALVHDRQGQAGVDPLAVDDDGAGAALAAVAAFFGAGQVQHFAQRVQQGHAGLDRQLVLGAVDVQRDGLGRYIRCGGGRRRAGGGPFGQDLFVLWHGGLAPDK
jgi:hypothetical protein